MKLRIRFAHQVVGLFVIIAVALIVVTLVSMGANQRWFARSYHYYSVFPTGQGLSVGMPISYKGFDIGKITAINLLADGNVRLDFFVTDTYRDRVVENSLLQLTTSPIGLGGGLFFHPGAADTSPLPEESLIPSFDSEEGRRIVLEELAVIPTQGDAVTRIVGEVEPVLQNVNRLISTVTVTLGTVNAVLAGEDVGPVADTLVQVNYLLEEVRTVLRSTNQQTNALLVEVRRTLSSTSGQAVTLMDQVGTTIETTSAEANTVLANVGAITDNLEATTRELRDPTGMVPRLLDPSGSIETLLNDNNALFLQIEEILRGMNATVDEINQFAGFVNGSRPDIAALLQESRETLDTGQDVLEGLKNNPLIRGGVPASLDQPTTFQSFRDESF